jgi:hypothetical protein
MRHVSRRNAVASAIPRPIPARQRYVAQPVWVVIHPVGIQHAEVPVEVPVKVRARARVRVPVRVRAKVPVRVRAKVPVKTPAVTVLRLSKVLFPIIIGVILLIIGDLIVVIEL